MTREPPRYPSPISVTVNIGTKPAEGLLGTSIDSYRDRIRVPRGVPGHREPSHPGPGVPIPCSVSWPKARCKSAMHPEPGRGLRCCKASLTTWPPLHHLQVALIAERADTLVCLIVLPVPGPGFRGRFGVSFGREPSANGPASGPKLPGLWARAVWDWFLNMFASGLRPKPAQTGPGSQTRGPEALLSILK
jgi:hypothetical protein